MNTRCNCKLFITPQEYTHSNNYYTSTLMVPSQTFEPVLAHGQAYTIQHQGECENKYIAIESRRSEYPSESGAKIKQDNFERGNVEIDRIGQDNPEQHMNEYMFSPKSFDSSYFNKDPEVECELNRLIAEHGEGKDSNWPLVQIPLDINYQVFRRRKRGDATNEWSNAFNTVQDPLQCTVVDPEIVNEPVCC